MNFDGAVFREIQRARVAVVVRNAEGCVLVSMAETFHLPFSVAVVEVIAARKALQFAKDIGLSSIILEGDSKIAIDGLKSMNSFLNEYVHLLVEAKEVADQMQWSFNTCQDKRTSQLITLLDMRNMLVSLRYGWRMFLQNLFL